MTTTDDLRPVIALLADLLYGEPTPADYVLAGPSDA